MAYLDEYGDPTDDQIMWWNEANDHAESTATEGSSWAE
jgi:hypothetical protein